MERMYMLIRIDILGGYRYSSAERYGSTEDGEPTLVVRIESLTDGGGNHGNAPW